MKLRIVTLALLALSTLGLGGCKDQPAVAAALGVVQNVITLAQADLPALQVGGVLTAGDVTAATNWLSAASTIVGQGQTCVAGIGTSGSTSALANCVTTIGTGLLSPTEMAQLRIISPKAQHQITVYVTAVVLGVNLAAQIVKATQTTTPVVGGGTTPSAVTTQELHILAVRAHVPHALMTQEGL
jgi:hypothetical protein